MNRRYFFQALASGLVAASSPGLFLPKLIKPAWKPERPVVIGENWYRIDTAPFDAAMLRYTVEIRSGELARVVKQKTLWLAKAVIRCEPPMPPKH
jgi:hypothetical protein